MLGRLRREVIGIIWQFYNKNLSNPYFTSIESNLYLDHFALITLNIDDLLYIFKRLGFVCAGNDYIESKQNFFVWLREEDYNNLEACKSLPQVVLGYFNIEVMPINIQDIVLRYIKNLVSFDYDYFNKLFDKALSTSCDDKTFNELVLYIGNFLNNINYDNSIISCDDYLAVKKYNELLSWVLIFGHRVNHFGIATHLYSSFNSFEDFIYYYKKKYSVTIDCIKGDKKLGIKQASYGVKEIEIFDRYTINQFFIEFVWRYPICDDSIDRYNNSHYYNGFISAMLQI